MDSSRLSYAPPAMLSQPHAAASPSQSRDHSRQGRRKLVVVAEAFPRPPSKSVTSGSPHSPDIELRDDDPMFSLSPTQLPDLMRSSDALPTTAPAKKYVGRGKQPRYDSEGTEASTLSTLPAEEHAQPVGRSSHAQDARVASSAGDGDATHTKPSAAPIATVPVLEEEEEYEHALGPGFGFDIGISLDF
ncbi:hypothetical protein EON66_04325 [archaeon]|nr:MAG: hypothetical protein EON66_04325 [archaeon]